MLVVCGRGTCAHIDVGMTLHTHGVEILVVQRQEPLLIFVLIGVDRSCRHGLGIDDHVGDDEGIVALALHRTVPCDLRVVMPQKLQHLDVRHRTEDQANLSVVVAVVVELLFEVNLAAEKICVGDALTKFLHHLGENFLGQVNRLSHCFPPLQHRGC